MRGGGGTQRRRFSTKGHPYKHTELGDRPAASMCAVLETGSTMQRVYVCVRPCVCTGGCDGVRVVCARLGLRRAWVHSFIIFLLSLLSLLFRRE